MDGILIDAYCDLRDTNQNSLTVKASVQWFNLENNLNWPL